MSSFLIISPSTLWGKGKVVVPNSIIALRNFEELNLKVSLFFDVLTNSGTRKARENYQLS